jgi:hypothetical protein
MDAGIVLVLVFIISYYVYRVVSSWSSFEARFKRRLEDRRAAILDRSSRRVNKVLDLLDMDNLGDDMMELMVGQRYIRCAVIMSREARRALRFPTHSKANEKIVCDWIERHYEDGITRAMRHRITPLAVKLAFVKSKHELEAEEHFRWLGSLVDTA